MLVNLETTLLEELFDAESERRWKAVAAGFLLNNDREIAARKIAEALKRYLNAGRPSSDPLIADHKLKCADFYAVALKLIHAAEAADPTFGKPSVAQAQTAA